MIKEATKESKGLITLSNNSNMEREWTKTSTDSLQTVPCARWKRQNRNVPIADDGNTRLILAISLVTELNVSTSGNHHILTRIEHLMGWPEANPIPNKKADIMVFTFINCYLLSTCIPNLYHLIMELNLKNQHIEDVLKQLGIDFILYTPLHPILPTKQRKTRGIQQILKTNTQKTMYKWPGQLRTIHKPGTYQPSGYPTPHHRWNAPLPYLCERPQASPTSIVRTHAVISQWPRFWINKFGNELPCTCHSQEKMYENRLKNAQKITDHIPPSLQVGHTTNHKTESTSRTKNLENGTWNRELY